MELLITKSAPLTAMIAAMIYFLTALFTGCWKYFCIRASGKAEAPYYVNIAHRAALMYSFSALLIAVFAALSAFPDNVNLIAVILPLIYFTLAIIRYIQLGIKNTTDNQHLNPANRTAELLFLLSLMLAEIGGFLTLAAGFVYRIMLLHV